MRLKLTILTIIWLATGCCPPCTCPRCPVLPALPDHLPEPDKPGPQPLPPLPIDDDDFTESDEVFTEPARELEAVEALTVPYPLTNPLRGFGRCRRGKRRHPAFDIGGVGEHGGLGTRIVSMAPAVVTFIGRGADDPHKFGRPDRRSGMATRGTHDYPRSRVIDGYGRVYFFTRSYGSWRSGNVIVTRVLEGPYLDYEIRYMHLADIHPALKVGDNVAAGQEIGLMGGTAVQESCPHVHVDMTDTQGNRVDVKALLGLDEPHGPCS
jgi:murein DD-endopeptidase MepM/ murein hydrolase activator NlpD